MIPVSEALNFVLNKDIRIEAEHVHLADAVGRVLAEDVRSDINMPPFNKAAMDGFAIREEDINKELEIIETIAAGQTPAKEISEGKASKIMTGAPVPKGANFVIQVELSELINETTVRFTDKPKNNIIPIAEDVSVGDIVLKKGQLIDARQVAVLASVGCPEPLVYKKPLVGILSTGSEIVEPNQLPKSSQIRNSNGHQLIAQVAQCNAEPKYFGIIKDDYNTTLTAIKTALESCNIILLTGGVSMGEFDFVPKIMTELGVKILFDRVAAQPGKPTTFGTIDDKFIFGLPGNPVSSFIQFEILVKPLINKFLGNTTPERIIKLPLATNFTRKKAVRTAYIPVNISDNSEVYTTEYHGSAHIYALPNANAIAEIPQGVFNLQKGDLVNVRLF